MLGSEQEKAARKTGSANGSDPSAADRHESRVGSPQPAPPLGFRLVLAAIVLVTVVYSVTMLTIGQDIKTPATAIAAMTGVFGVIGTLVGTYFGVKVGLDGQDRVKQAAEGAGRGRER